MTKAPSLPGVRNHAALNNRLLDRTGDDLSSAELRCILANYYVFTEAFPRMLAGLISRCASREVRFQLTQILYSEMGSGEIGGTHEGLFASLVSEYETDSKQGFDIRSGETLVSGLRSLYLEENLDVALGAQTALELQAGMMLEKLGRAFVSGDSKRDSLPRFFAVHIEDEPGHEKAMMSCLETAVENSEQFLDGFKRCLDEFSRFWNSLDSACTLVRG